MDPILPLVLVTYPLPEGWLTPLAGRVQVVVAPPGTRGFPPNLVEHFGKTAGILTMLTDIVDDELLERLPNLRVVSNMAVGVDNIDLTACTRRGISVGHTPGVLTDATADLALALLLAASRRIKESSADAIAGRWKDWTPTGWLGADIAGTTVGIVGLGNIGRAIANRVRVFEAKMVYTSRYPKPDAEIRLGISYLHLEELLRQSDHVILAVDLNKSTRGLMDETALRMMKPTATLVNIARGPVVVTAALVRALEEGWIASAALDVTDPEPLPPDHALYTFPNCLITPHIGSATGGARRRMAELACENLLAGVEGRPLVHAVN